MTSACHLSPKFKDFWCYLIQAILINDLKDLFLDHHLSYACMKKNHMFNHIFEGSQVCHETGNLDISNGTLRC